MDKAYMLDDYISDQDKNLIEKEEADTNLDKLEFRIHGSKTIEEIKKEVSIFLEKNDVPFEVEEGLKKICSEFNENTDIYHASLYLENFMKQYLENKEKNYQESNDTILEIKEDLVDGIKKDLDDVGISISGSKDLLIDSIQSEADVYKLKDNVERTTDYFEERKDFLIDENKTLVELPSEEIAEVLENPTDETLLNNVLEQQEVKINNDPQVEVNNDGSVVVHGDAENTESMNFAAMMTTALVASSNDYGFDQNLDMKFIKDPEKDATFKIIYADFPLQPNNTVDPMISSKVGELVNNYQSQVSYMELLGTKSPELMTALTLIREQVLNEKGAFQMAVKNNSDRHEMRFAVDENYAHVYTAFSESGAMVTHDAMENGIIRVIDTMPGEQLLVLSTTLDSLRQRKKEVEENELALQNQYQKQLIYSEENSEAANVHKTFLIVALVTEMLLLLIGTYFLFR